MSTSSRVAVQGEATAADALDRLAIDTIRPVLASMTTTAPESAT